jgi:NitT/TauT family transport system ATP-binding protein
MTAMSHATPSSTVVSAKDLGLTFQTADGPVTALTGVNLAVEKGDFVSFIGPSGASSQISKSRHQARSPSTA